MKKRSVIIYWLLMLVPAVAVSLSVFRLLAHEQDRINRTAVASRLERAEAIAESLRVTVDAVETQLQQALYEIPAARLEETLLSWVAANPLIRNVFVWEEGAGLEYPLAGKAATAEERRFTDRFAGLFSGRIPWSSGHTDEETVAGGGGKKQNVVSPTPPSGRQALLEMARVKEPAAASKSPAGAVARSGGWLPWFVENRLYILGWVRSAPDGPVYGVELELMTLLSRLIADFPSGETAGAVYALKDDSGRILHQVGGVPIDRDTVPEATVSLAPQLPHWQLAVYTTGEKSGPLAGRGFLILSGLLLVIFMAAVIFGGGMLTWQAHRNRQEALQKTSFVANVSHELKTPLTSIRMYAELLAGGRITQAEKKRRYLDVIVSETRRLTRLVNNVLDFSRLEQGRKKYHTETIDLTACLRDILAAQALPVKEAGMILERDLPGRDILVLADRDALDQVMVNLIDNAVKYGADGGALTVSLAIDDGRALITVSDRGPGVPEAHRERIFEQFHRVDDSLTAARQGSGLGLSIARRILRDLGGDLSYRPGADGGAVFIASLSLAEQHRTGA